MLETYLRPAYQYGIADPIATKFQKFSPMKITLSACTVGLLVLPALLLRLPMLAVILLLMSGFLDTLDGSIARMTDNVSNKGCVLDIISDRIVELVVMLGLFLVDPQHRGWIMLLMLGSCYICITSFLVVGMFTPKQSEKGFYYSSGLIERFETFIFFVAMIIFPKNFVLIAYLFTILVLVTSFLRIREFFLISS